jgi:hypothetical protein
MSSIPAYQSQLWDSAIEELFDEPDRQDVKDWLIGLASRMPFNEHPTPGNSSSCDSAPTDG